MADDSSPFDAMNLVRTLASVSRHQKRDDDADILIAAQPSIKESGYDNWNGGTTFYSLILDLPPGQYAKVEPRLDSTEKRILERVKPLARGVEGAMITEVLIRTSIGVEVSTAAFPPSDEQTHRLWLPNTLRVFLSHVSSVKTQTHQLKQQLVSHRISAFVAHDDVAPTLPWEQEIENALRSMDALVALVTPTFIESKWCDQEVGFALGANRLVVPVRTGADPYGFIGKHQGVQGKGKTPKQLADELALILLNHPQSRPAYLRALIEQLEHAGSWSVSKDTMTILERAGAVDETFLLRIENACSANSEVSEAFGVSARIQALCRRHRGMQVGYTAPAI